MPNDFTPLTHEELRELWKQAEIFGSDYNENYAPSRSHELKQEARRLILSAVWWAAMEERATFYARHHQDRSYCRECSALERDDRHERSHEDWFLAKLAEIGIDWREDET